MRLLGCFVVALALVAGCGDDTTATSAADLSVRADLTGAPSSCSAADVMQSCAGVSGGTSCYVCDFTGGGGSCARPCLLLQPDCPAGETCHEFTVGDGGANVTFVGSNCDQHGYCR